MFKSSLLKKVLAFLVLAIFLITPHAQAFTLIEMPNINLTPIDKNVTQSLGSKTLPAIAKNAIASGIKPAEFKNISLRLKPNVQWLSNDQVQIIKNHASNGKISASLLPNVEPGKIYVDEASLTAVEFIPGEGNIFYIVLADDDAIVEELSIPEQTIFLNEANITSHAQGINIAPIKMKSGTGIESTGFNITFNETHKLPGYDQDGKLVQVTLKGNIRINSPAVEVKYTKNNGYKFIFMTSETAEVSAELISQLKKDVKIPIKEFAVPSKACKVTVGLFLVLGVDGKITLEYTLKQSIFVKAGFAGDTKAYMPTSFQTVRDLDFAFTPEEFSLTADLKGEASLLAEVTFDILGKGKVNIDNKTGVLLEVKANAGTGGTDYLNIKGDGFVKITGKVKVKSFDKSKTIYEYKYPLFNYVKSRSSSYEIKIVEACSYNDTIQGVLINKNTAAPYANKTIQLKVTNSAGAEANLTAVTNSEGVFKTSYNLQKGDKIRIKVPETENLYTPPYDATFPFNHIVVDFADFLSEKVQGYVSSSANNTLLYNGPLYLIIERSNNIPLHHEKNLTLPVTYTIKRQAQCKNGVFILESADIRPYDKVYAYIEREGFSVMSQKVDADGMDIFAVGNFLQEPDRLSSPGSSVIINNLRNLKNIEGEIKYKVYIMYPHSTRVEDSIKAIEWQLRPSQAQDVQYSMASTEPWEINLKNYSTFINSPLNKFRMLFSGKGSINYHVYEMVEFYYEGKKIEWFNETKNCETERMSGITDIYLPNIKESPADYYIKSLETMLIDLRTGASQISDNCPEGNENINPFNFYSNVSLKEYKYASDSSPALTKNFMLYSLNHQQKVETGPRDYSILWDRSARTKVLVNQEFGMKENVRYDLDDYIPELVNVNFIYIGSEVVNGVLCKVYEKRKKLAPNLEIYHKVRLYISQNNDLPVKVEFQDGYFNKIELVFSNHKKASDVPCTSTGGAARIFGYIFGEIKMPKLDIQFPGQSQEAAGGIVPSETPQEEGVESQGNPNTQEISQEISDQRILMRLYIGRPIMDVNGKNVEIDPGRGTVPVIIDSRTLVPIRVIVETLGGQLGWDGSNRKVTIAGKDSEIEMWIGKKEMLVNGANINNDVPPMIINSRTYVPLRFVAENLKCSVEWDGNTRRVTIISP